MTPSTYTESTEDHVLYAGQKGQQQQQQQQLSRTELLTQNRAFDGYKILRAGGRGATRRTALFPEITLRRVLFLALWVAIQAVILIYKIVKGAQTGSALGGFASGTMACLMFSMCSIFIFMSPTLLELLRRTFIARHVSIEKNIHAHKIASYSVFVWMIAHVATYYYFFDLGAKSSNGRTTLAKKLFTTKVGITGHIMLLFYVIIFVTSVPAIRRRIHELFYYSHHLFILLIPLYFIHGGAHTFQWYFIGPGVIYFSDRMYRFCRSRFRHPRILTVIQHPSNVIELRIEKRGMSPQVGQYVYLNVPSISWLQWHPFTLTSAPEEDELTLHIWVGGDWTRKLVSALQECAVNPTRNTEVAHEERQRSYSKASITVSEKLGNVRIPNDPSNLKTLSALADQELLMQHLRIPTNDTDPLSGLPIPAAPGYNPLGHHRGSSDGGLRPWSRVGRNSTVLLDRLPPEMDYRLSGAPAYSEQNSQLINHTPLMSLPRVMVDGPYGAPTQQVFDYECVVLVGGGIGVTPMSSVLKSLYYQLTMPSGMRKIRKVYFLWVCRHVQALEWFQDLLSALDEEDIGDMLEIRTYLTGQLSVDQIRNIALYHDPEGGPDAVTGLYRSPTYYGRPNFNSILSDIGSRNPNTDIGVFFCGPKPMGRNLRKITRKWTRNLRNIQTKFVFHKENF